MAALKLGAGRRAGGGRLAALLTGGTSSWPAAGRGGAARTDDQGCGPAVHHVRPDLHASAACRRRNPAAGGRGRAPSGVRRWLGVPRRPVRAPGPPGKGGSSPIGALLDRRSGPPVRHPPWLPVPGAGAGMLGRPLEALASSTRAGRRPARGEPGRASSPCRTTSARGCAQPRPAGRGRQWTAQALARARRLPAAGAEMRYAACLDRVEGRLLSRPRRCGARRWPRSAGSRAGRGHACTISSASACSRPVRPGPRGAGPGGRDGRGGDRRLRRARYDPLPTLAVLAAARPDWPPATRGPRGPRRRTSGRLETSGRPGGVAGHRRAGRGAGVDQVVAADADGGPVRSSPRRPSTAKGCAASSGRPSPLRPVALGGGR